MDADRIGGPSFSQVHGKELSSRIKIMDAIRRYPPFSWDGLDEIRTAVKIEDKIYDVALSQTDYLRTISLKMIMIASRPESLGRMRPSNLKRRRILARDL
ncbi:hypothetical protein PRUPE_6G198300 [Prunus persica]|uniref:Mediator complex subunit 15 KIX domain-containing protein n=1 Tax=Prunus persica TaxID=3760 RepID=A0A251NSX6_PRUPE|nr:mediator of RNA polymerase II transcription subunit 15a-like [Prunus persica]ONI02432.1 hypothetical protein PRUPE_6G198300 [Prunus persica]